MFDEHEGIHVRDGNDEATGKTMINLAMALMRETKAAVERVDQKLDKIADERRNEAREHGGLEVRLEVLEASHRTTRGIATTVAAAIIILALGFLLRLAVLHPETVAK